MFWSVGAAEKKPPNCHKHRHKNATFGVVFSTSFWQKRIEKYSKNILATALKSYIQTYSEISL